MNSVNAVEYPEGVAIIGMAGRFPGAKNIDEFWQNLQNGVESISSFSEQELLAAGIEADTLYDANYVRARGILEQSDQFDAEFFNYTPREAEILDPQQRIFLECAWEALEHAGYDPETYGERTGVYGGASLNNYLVANLYTNRDLLGAVGLFQTMNSNEKDFLTTRTSYKLNLRGPSVNVQTACSTSLVAVHMACQSLLSGECDMALAGGVSVNVPQKSGYLYQTGGILSPDGHCRAFDASAQGIVPGDGVAIVVLRRLADALADGDTIHAVIKGSAINNDGSLKIGYTAPSVDGQARVIAEAQALAGVDPQTISYIEAHGTGTPLGDPIEFAALSQVFRAVTERKGFCALGSVKTNIGHLDITAGVAGLIKTVLALKRGLLPPSLHFERPNPKLDIANSPFYIVNKATVWEAGATARRAGISSFGIGGTNAHVVLEEAPAVVPVSTTRPYSLLLFSAKTASALDVRIATMADHLKQNPTLKLADVAYTLQVGRRAFAHRCMLVCRDGEDAAATLEARDAQRIVSSVSHGERRAVVFLFPGQGTQYVQMGHTLYHIEPAFRKQVDRCAQRLIAHLGLDIRDLLYPEQDKADEGNQRLEQTALTQPVLFVIEYALAQMWMEWGVKPQAMLGHSIGEYVAACLAGVLSLEDALALIATRGRLMQSMAHGSMLSIPLAEAQVVPLLGEKLSLAAINTASSCVVAGPEEAVEELERQLAEKHVACRRLQTSHAFHSQMMSPVVGPFVEQVKRLHLHAPTIPYLSNVTGTWITAQEATDPKYWARHLCQPVRFAAGLHELLRTPEQVYLEIGPGRTLSGLMHEQAAKEQVEGQTVYASLPHRHEKQSEYSFLLHTVGRLWLAGVVLNWQQMGRDQHLRRVPMPTYPFERKRYWVLPGRQRSNASSRRGATTAVKQAEIENWFAIPSWKRAPLASSHVGALFITPVEAARVLIFADEAGLALPLAQRLEQAGCTVITVRMGERFARVQQQAYTINLQRREDYHALLQELHMRHLFPSIIAHCWTVTREDDAAPDDERLHRLLNQGFYSLLLLAQALEQLAGDETLRVEIISNNVQALTGEEALEPEKATVWGLGKVIAQECPNIWCRGIDVVLPHTTREREERLLEQLVREVLTPVPDDTVAYRGPHRWVQVFEPIRLERVGTQEPRVREGGVYLITGGLGSIGLAQAQYLAQLRRVKLVLVGRSALPVRSKWVHWLATHDDQDRISRRMRSIQALEQLGSQVLICHADIADAGQMREVMAEVDQYFGALHGVIHSAGIVSDEAFLPLREMDKAQCEKHFRPKVRGLQVLGELLEGRELDFCLLQSSLAAVLGGVTYAAYAAANSFMDAFAHNQQARALPWISVNWDGWQTRGEQASAERKAPMPSTGAFDMFQHEGIEAFARILSMEPVPQVVVSTGNLQARIDRWIKRDDIHTAGEPEEGDVVTPGSARPPLAHTRVAPRNESEQTIASVWQAVLGIEQIGVHDNFFDLGGHSVMAIQIVARLRKLLQRELGTHTLFEHPTVAQLAEVVAQPASHNTVPQQPVLKPLARGQRGAEVREQATSSSWGPPSRSHIQGEREAER